LAKGADINIQTLDSATAFTLLNTNNSKNDSKIQELFLSHADKLLAIQAQNNNDHDASLMVACRDGNLPNVERLLEQQANIDAQSSLGRTPLMFATKHNQKDVVEFLLDQGANPVLIDHRKQPALRYTDNKEIKLLILTNIKAKIKK
jgi:ankyrin repeat protein